MRDDLEDLINTVAYRLYRRYKPYTEASDIRQEMWAWALGQPESKLEGLDAPILQWRLRSAGEALCRREKAARSGYSADDEIFYGMRVIRELLHEAVSDEPVVMRGVEERVGHRTKGNSVPMEYETAIADLRYAYTSGSDTDRELLARYVAGDLVPESDVTRAIRRMQRRLGGRRPVVEPIE